MDVSNMTNRAKTYQFKAMTIGHLHNDAITELENKILLEKI